MCRPTQQQLQQRSLRVLWSLDSFHECNEKPNLSSCVLTIALLILFLTSVEHTCRYIFAIYRDAHELFENEVNRQILARHLGVDTLSCLLCAATGWQAREVFEPLMAALRGHKNAMPAAGHEQRLYTYHPGAFRVALIFLGYQLKNLVDTIAWNDGPEFIFHHVFSIFTAYGSMSSGVGLFYAIFFFGISEVSTAILCVLANFVDEHGVVGLGDAFPMTKVVVGLFFVVAFIVCRCILWPIFSYHFSRDVLLALKGDDVRTKTRRGWLKFFLVSLSSLSVLQVAWLGQILVIAQQELKGVGLL